jgi:hypothetical protein
MDIRNNIARVSKIEVTKAEEFGARLALHLQIELRTEQLSQFTEGRYGIADRAVYAELYEAWRKEFEEAEARWQDRTNRIMAEYNAACEEAEEDGRPRPKPPAIRDFCGPAEPVRIKTSRACNSLAGWFVDLRAELAKADHSVVTVELGAKTKGKPKMVTEGELVLLELRLDERKCERTAERDEVWEWLQLAGQEFRVFGAQLTIDDVLDDVEFEEVALPQLSLERLNVLAATVEAELQAKGYDAEVEAVQLEQFKTLATWAAELGMCGASEYIDALRRTGFEGRIGPVTRITQAQHVKVLEELGVLPRCDIGQIMESVKFEMPQPVDVWAKECDVHPDTYASAMTSAMGLSWATARAANLTRREHELVRAELATWVPDEAPPTEPESEESDKTAAYWADIAGVPQDDYMAALQAIEQGVDWGTIVPAESHEKAVGLLERWAERDSKRDEQSEAERRDFGVCKTANTWAREAGANAKAYVRTAVGLGVFAQDASPIRVKFNENTHLRIMAAMSGEQPAA